MSASVNEAVFNVGKRSEEYVVVPVAVLESLRKLILNGHTFEFRKTVPGEEVLMRCLASRTRNPDSWSFVFDKERRRIYRKTEGRLVSVEWGQ